MLRSYAAVSWLFTSERHCNCRQLPTRSSEPLKVTVTLSYRASATTDVLLYVEYRTCCTRRTLFVFFNYKRHGSLFTLLTHETINFTDTIRLNFAAQTPHQQTKKSRYRACFSRLSIKALSGTHIYIYCIAVSHAHYSSRYSQWVQLQQQLTICIVPLCCCT